MLSLHWPLFILPGEGLTASVSNAAPALVAVVPHSMDQAITRQKIKELRALVNESDKIAIVLQDDPDPDAMSSAIALRTLLGRNKLTTPIFAFKPVTRPENRTMTHLLEIEIAQADTDELRTYDKIAMVDVE